MLLLALSSTLSMIFQVHATLFSSDHWNGFAGNLAVVDDEHKTTISGHLMMCANLAKAQALCLFCITGTSCVFVGEALVPADNSVSEDTAQCYDRSETFSKYY